MDLRFSDEDERFRRELREFLEDSLAGEFAVARGRGGPGDEHAMFDERVAWERHLAAHGWTCVAWPKEHGGRGLSLHAQVIYFEEYARARAPGRVGHVGEMLLGPTLIAFGSPAQQARFLPGIVHATELWCQGYSEPDAGSDLANLKTRAERDGDDWVVNGQKVWTSLAHWAQWCFVLARTNPAAPVDPDALREGVGGDVERGHRSRKHKGISYLLVPMDQPGIEIRPIVQITGDSEFNEVFFNGARTPVENVVGAVDDGWRVAMGTLAFERGASTLGQNLMFRTELDDVIDRVRGNGRATDPVVRQRVADLWTRLQLMRLNALRIMSYGPDTPPSAMITKLFWSNVHRDMGELAMDVLGAEATLRTGEGDDYSRLQRLFLFSRADTIYAGTNEIQRNIIGERALGLPREPT